METATTTHVVLTVITFLLPVLNNSFLKWWDIDTAIICSANFVAHNSDGKVNCLLYAFIWRGNCLHDIVFVVYLLLTRMVETDIWGLCGHKTKCNIREVLKHMLSVAHNLTLGCKCLLSIARNVTTTLVFIFTIACFLLWIHQIKNEFEIKIAVS